MKVKKQFIELTGIFLDDLFNGYSVQSYLNDFEKHTSLNKTQIELIQLNKIQKLIEHSYLYSNFYKNRLKSIGALPGDFTSIQSINKIPPLTREDIQNNWKEILSKNINPKNLRKGSSSGSTGEPVFYFKDRKALSAGKAAGYLCWKMAGWRLGMKGLHIWGNPTTVQNEWKRKSSKIKAWYLNHYKFPAYQLTEKSRMLDLVKYLKKTNFEFIDGYTNSIYLVAEHMRRHNDYLDKPLKMVLTTAENLQDYQRKTIEDKLGPVYDLYGCSEINGIAGECCICNKYHVIDTHVLLEFGEAIDEFENQPFIITDLDNFAFPLIRYLNGDAGKPFSSNINCNLPFNQLERVSGRQSDIILLPGGGTLSVPSFFGSMLLKKVKGIIKYQIEKDREDHLLIKFVINSDFDKQDINIIKDSLTTYLANKILWDIIFVDDIPVSKTGKFKLVIDKTKD